MPVVTASSYLVSFFILQGRCFGAAAQGKFIKSRPLASSSPSITCVRKPEACGVSAPHHRTRLMMMNLCRTLRQWRRLLVLAGCCQNEQALAS